MSDNIRKFILHAPKIKQAGKKDGKREEGGNEDFLPVHIASTQKRPAESLDYPGHGVEEKDPF